FQAEDGIRDRNVTGVQTCALPIFAGRDQFRRGRVEFSSDGTTVAHIIGGSGSHLITQAVEATHLIRIPAGTQLGIGSVVQVYPPIGRASWREKSESIGGDGRGDGK